MMWTLSPFETLAVVGMEAAWAGCADLSVFERLVYEQATGYANQAAPASDILLGQVAQRALTDAVVDPHSGIRVAVLWAGGVAPQSSWSWAAAQEDLSRRANPLAAALVAARRLLSSETVDAVLFAAGSDIVGLPNGVPLALDATGLGFSRDVHGWRIGQGAGAVVFMDTARAQREGRRVYAVIQAAAWNEKEDPDGTDDHFPAAPPLDDVRGCIRAALEVGRVEPQQVALVEVFASGVDGLDGIEIAGLVQAYRLPEQDLTTAISSVQANTGYLGAAAGLAGLVHTVLCLSQRIIPGAPGWSAPKLPALWRGSPFYVPVESRAWFHKNGGSGRLAALNTFGQGGSFAHVILREGTEQPVGVNQALPSGGFYLFPLAADNLPDLFAELEELRQALAFAPDLDHLAGEYFAAASGQPEARYALALVGHDHAELLRETEFALAAVPTAVEKNSEWQTPLGSTFAPEPAGRLGGVALVYPGAFNSYPGVGKDLLRLFPSLYHSTAEITSDLGGVIHERLLYPRSLTALSKEELVALEAKLLADPIAMLISGTTLAILYTHILQRVFGVRPAASFGYSLGENSMLYATGVWEQGDEASARLAGSDAFRARLAGPQLAVREYWSMPAANGSGSQPLWSNFLVMAAPEKVRPALQKEPRVYMTHINTPRQVVIGGDPQGCQRVLAELRASSIQAPFDYALHCEVMRSEFGALAELHNWPVRRSPGLRMYSAADYGPLELEQAELARKMAHMLTTPLDFPRLVQRVYADGARVFIEAGAGSNCARWVSESLKGSPHLALSLNRRGTDDYSTIVRTLARLYSHRVPVDLSPLYQADAIKKPV